MSETASTKFPQPFYFIAFSVVNESGEFSQFRSLFSNEPGSFKFFLEKEDKGFRYAGWGFPHNVQYVIQLDGLEYQDRSRRAKILEEGHLLFQGAVDESFLCWANSSVQSTLKKDRTQINTTALIEFTYNCVAILKKALQDTENPKTVVCKFGFVGLDENYVLGDAKLPAQNDPFNHSWNMNPIGVGTEAAVTFPAASLQDHDGSGKIAFSILAKVYRMFGFTEDIISYADLAKKKIDTELFKKA